LFFPIINPQQRTKPQTQISTKRQTHISNKANLSLQTHKFSWQTNTEKPTKKEKKTKNKQTNPPNHHRQIKEYEYQIQAKE